MTDARILVTGGCSGLGRAIREALWQDYGLNTFSYDITAGFNVLDPKEHAYLWKKDWDILINCAGINIINWLENVTEEEWDAVMDINVKGIFRMTQAMLPSLKRNNGTVLNIVSNAAHMPMRCSAAYNASKGAALILTKQLARELTSQGVTVFSVSPNKLSGTGMSNSIDRQVVKTRGWTLEEAQKYQLTGLLTGEETPPERCAEFIAFLLSSKERHKYLAGCDIPYGN
jgi:NAD(P)-dependent dehydrogenase (short-subunit alcohol dehydrogenase family)